MKCLGLLAIIAFSGCMVKVSDKKKSDDATVAAVQAFRVEPLAQLHRYRVVIRGRGGVSPTRLTMFAQEVRMLNHAAISTEPRFIDRGANEIVDESVQEGAVYAYHFGDGDDVQIRVPYDVNIAQSVDSSNPVVAPLFQNGLPEPTKGMPPMRLGRVNFEPNAVLTTLGKTLVLNPDSLVVGRGATLRTFADGSAAITADGATLPAHGADGGNIVIDARSGTGTLIVEMRGQNGAGGFKGAAQGKAATAGMSGTSYASSGFDGSRVDICAQQASPQRTGSRGLRGLPGGRGGTGGDTGKLEVISEPDSRIRFEVRPYVGQGGAPGEGGDGGKGGDPSGIAIGCRDIPGIQGADGDPGIAGAPGAPGNNNSGYSETGVPVRPY